MSAADANPRRIGVDLGGTKIEVAVLDEGGGVRLRERHPTPSDDYAAIVRAVVALVHSAEQRLGPAQSVGVGTPGAVSPTSGTMKNSNTMCLNGQPLGRDLVRALGRPVHLANDANCFALSEALDGAARGARVVFGVIVGTGTGAGIVVDGQLLMGVNAIAGEWGHCPLPWAEQDEQPGPRCYCGQYGCLETFLSGPGMSRDHERTYGPRLQPAEIAARAEAGDANAAATFERYAARMARGLASVINILDPDAIVLGGGLSNLTALYERVPALWKRWVFSDHVETRLLRHRHGDSSGVRGAALLATAGFPAITGT